ncbi:hypothetical protein NGA_0166400 [Nannochloropsis gaditana CCMP526]|uniref:uncharacterized protein n=1 Tax=Nannochloropsis gaditana (strain CCMP526) TaxID=1093141 RepID=UPI00029F6273|nr:hypothetical protein NGA_0166400 [Nannochloropsis gaditana CCMP526]EKU22205.1 hypothetical protein NGA_0166400 [Nannochloropsis gaditana CCMP526]|eukprot:XP_005854153.1 hypothetical protein NGA_0166400 [Nannochloropsis gaditana CCMP526]
MKRAEMKEDWIRTYLMGLEGHTKIQWPEGQIPEGWSEFFAARQLGHQVSANSNSGMCLSELLHEGLTVAMAAKRFGLLGGRGGREGHGGDHGRHRRPFRLHILGATETQEIQRLPLSMGELGALLCPFYFEGKPPPLPSGAGRINYRHASSRLTVVSPSFLPSLPPSSTPKGLEVSVFGPQVMTPTAFRVSLAEGKETARDITVWKSNLLYHDWVLSHEGSKEAPPDLVVALNSGLHTGGEIWRGGGGRKVEGKRQKKHSEWWRLSLSQPPPTAMPPVLDIISDDHHHVDGSMWLPTLTYLVASGIPFLLTMYDAEEGRKTLEMLESFDACVAWGPDLNPMRSLVLEETEAPALQRYARLVADGRMDAGADEPDGNSNVHVTILPTSRVAARGISGLHSAVFPPIIRGLLPFSEQFPGPLYCLHELPLR